ncbi:MAG: glycosyl hydrolase [candidate division Zixibacteria bacterium]|nr:glycosyl hydrolase [candidate division Zixibacteria bacterium]
MCASTRWWVTALAAAVLLVGGGLAVQAQTPIDSYTFGAIQARDIGPATMSGRIMSIDAVHSDRRIIYVGTASGGVWKTENAGITFEPIFDDHTMSIGCVTIDQARPDTVWVGTGEGRTRNSVSVGTGLYRTTDGGDNWEFMGFENSERIIDVFIHPDNSDVIYVGVLGHLWNANEERGVYQSTDGGDTWEQILYIDENTGCADLEIDPENPDVLYAAMWEFRRSADFFISGGDGSGLYKTTDGGKTWTRLEEGLPTGEVGRIGLSIAPSNPRYVYAVVESDDNALYRSEDSGASWVKTSTSFNVQARPFYFADCVVDPVDSLRVYKPGVTLTVSDDGGEAFTSPFRGGGNVHSDMHSLWIDPNDREYMLVGTDGGVYESRDRGNTWRMMQNLPLAQYYRVSVDMMVPYNVYGGLQDNGSWYGPSRSPGGIQNKDWQSVGYGDGFCIFRDPSDPDVIYWELQGGEIHRYHVSTKDIKEIKPYPEAGMPKLRFNWNTPLVKSPNNPKAIYCGAQFLYRSTDQGESWVRLSDDLTTDDPEKQRQEETGGLTIDNSTAENHCTIFTIAESPVDSNVIWVGTDDGNVQVTTDQGGRWTNVVSNIDGLPEHTWCSTVEPSHHDRATAYATFDGHYSGDMTTYVYKTTDFGESWTSIVTDSIDGYAHVIREDFVNPNLLFVGTEFGLYVTVDGGQQWARFTGNLPKVSVRDMVIHPRESDLVVSSHGRGIFIIDDITPLRELTTGVLDDDLHFLASRPTPIRIPKWEQGFAGDQSFVGRNPSDVAKITYYMKKRHMFGDFRVEVYNPEGELLKTLPGGKQRGINRVSWHMRKKPPRVPPAPSLAGGALFGPMLPAGDYMVKVIRPKDTASGVVSVVYDPDSPHSTEDRALQQETVLQLYDMQERLAFIAESVTDARDQAEARADSLDNNEDLEESLRDFAERLDDLHKTLVATKEGWLTGEEQLREHVVGLYSAVSGYGGRPTDSQLDRMAVLEDRIAEKNDAYETILGDNLASLNTQLEAAGMDTITRLTQEEYDKRFPE